MKIGDNIKIDGKEYTIVNEDENAIYVRGEDILVDNEGDYVIDDQEGDITVVDGIQKYIEFVARHIVVKEK